MSVRAVCIVYLSMINIPLLSEFCCLLSAQQGCILGNPKSVISPRRTLRWILPTVGPLEAAPRDEKLGLYTYSYEDFRKSSKEPQSHQWNYFVGKRVDEVRYETQS